MKTAKPRQREEWIRKCPTCPAFITYKTRPGFYQAILNGTHCSECKKVMLTDRPFKVLHQRTCGKKIPKKSYGPLPLYKLGGYK